MPTRPTRLAPGECVTLTAVAPGMLEVSCIELLWRPLGGDAWQAIPMGPVGRRTYALEFQLPPAVVAVEYKIQATFAASPSPVVLCAPPAGGATAYVISQ